MAFEFFSKDLDELELKFLGFYITLILGIVSAFVGVDLITGFLSGLLMMMGRDLYRKETNTAKGVSNGKNSNGNTSGNGVS